MSGETDDEPVPKLPRGRGMKLSGPQLFRIFSTIVALLGVIFLARPCASSVSNFVMGYQQGSGSAASQLPKPGNVEPPRAPAEDYSKYEELKPGMSEQEIKAAIERSKAKNAAAAAGSGSAAAAAPAAGSGSSAP